ncbi:MAG: hypothetical protein QM655_07865 [Nocardioidaceae bacterium]
MKLSQKAALITAIAASSVAGVAPAANAWDYQDNKACTGGGGVLNMSISYDLTSTQHIWGIMYGTATGDAGSQNNFRGRIYESGDKVWEHLSADTYGKGEQWYKNVLTASGTHLRTQRSATEKVVTHVWFDQFGNDPECDATITY